MVLAAPLARIVEAIRAHLSRRRAARLMIRLSPHLRHDIGWREERTTTRRDENARAWML